MIPAESRMREIRTSGSTSGGVETDRMGAGLSTKRKRGQEKHRTLPGTAPPPDSTITRRTETLDACSAPDRGGGTNPAGGLSHFDMPVSRVLPRRRVGARSRHRSGDTSTGTSSGRFSG